MFVPENKQNKIRKIRRWPWQHRRPGSWLDFDVWIPPGEGLDLEDQPGPEIFPGTTGSKRSGKSKAQGRRVRSGKPVQGEQGEAYSPFSLPDSGTKSDTKSGPEQNARPGAYRKRGARRGRPLIDLSFLDNKRIDEKTMPSDEREMRLEARRRGLEMARAEQARMQGNSLLPLSLAEREWIEKIRHKAEAGWLWEFKAEKLRQDMIAKLEMIGEKARAYIQAHENARATEPEAGQPRQPGKGEQEAVAMQDPLAPGGQELANNILKGNASDNKPKTETEQSGGDFYSSFVPLLGLKGENSDNNSDKKPQFSNFRDDLTFKPDGFGSLTNALRHFPSFPTAWRIQKEARAVTREIYPDRVDKYKIGKYETSEDKVNISEGKANAFLHAYLSYRLAQELGPEIAKKFTDANEVLPVHTYVTPPFIFWNKREEIRNSPILRAERDVDLYNNGVGRFLLEKKAPPDEIKNIIKRLADEGHLKVVGE